MVPTRRPAALSTDCVIATTEPLPFVPPTSAPRRPRSGWPTSSISRSTRSKPRLMPKRPRSVMAATAWRYVSVKPSVRGVLVEDAVVELPGQAQVVDVPGVEVHAAAQLASAHGAFLLEQRAHELRRLDRDAALRP